MRRYKIAFLVSHPIQYMSPLFEEMAKHPQIDLTVLYCSDEGVKRMRDIEFQKEIKWDIPMLDGYRYKFLKNYSPVPTIFNAPFGLINIGIIEEIWSSRYDAIVIHGWHYMTYRLAFVVALLKKIPIYIRSESPLFHEILKPRWKIMIKKLALGTLFKKITGFFAIGSENKEFYKFYGVKEDKIYWTPYSVDNKRLIESFNKLRNDREEIKKGMGIPSNGVVILFCGKLIDKKRPMDLLMAYEKLDFENKFLIFLGDGKLSRKLKNHVEKRGLKNIIFTGFVNQSGLSKYYVIADIFVLPSTIGETWGLVVNEAMCFRLPVVASDLVGCGKDLVKQGENGCIFETGNIEELANYMDKLTKDPILRKSMGNRSFEIIQGWNYKSDIDGMIKALECNEINLLKR